MTYIFQNQTSPPKNLLNLSNFMGSKILLDWDILVASFHKWKGGGFAIGDDEPVKEGTLLCLVALLVKSELEIKGAIVKLTRKESQPAQIRARMIL